MKHSREVRDFDSIRTDALGEMSIKQRADGTMSHLIGFGGAASYKLRVS